MNRYTLAQRTAKARMITMQEVIKLGCSASDNSCPVWMHNYLNTSTSYGGTVDYGTDYGYWTLSADSSTTTLAGSVRFRGFSTYLTTSNPNSGARAVVMINKTMKK